MQDANVTSDSKSFDGLMYLLNSGISNKTTTTINCMETQNRERIRSTCPTVFIWKEPGTDSALSDIRMLLFSFIDTLEFAIRNGLEPKTMKMSEI